jgi:hypothetical protein
MSLASDQVAALETTFVVLAGVLLLAVPLTFAIPDRPPHTASLTTEPSPASGGRLPTLAAKADEPGSAPR